MTEQYARNDLGCSVIPAKKGKNDGTIYLHKTVMFRHFGKKEQK